MIIYPQLAKEAFKWRTRMVQFKLNFPNGTNNIECPLGCQDDDSQESIITCSAIIDNFPEFQSTSINYFDLFSNNPNKIKDTTDFLVKMFNKREVLLARAKYDDDDDSNSSQV